MLLMGKKSLPVGYIPGGDPVPCRKRCQARLAGFERRRHPDARYYCCAIGGHTGLVRGGLQSHGLWSGSPQAWEDKIKS